MPTKAGMWVVHFNNEQLLISLQSYLNIRRSVPEARIDPVWFIQCSLVNSELRQISVQTPFNLIASFNYLLYCFV